MYKEGSYPKKKKDFFEGEFSSRQKARNFCRKRSYEVGMTIVHPDGNEEKYIK